MIDTYGLPWTLSHSKQKHAKISESNFHTFGCKPVWRQREGGVLLSEGSENLSKFPPSRFIWDFNRPACQNWRGKKDCRETTFLFCKLILTIVSFVTSLVFPHSFSDPKRLDFLVMCRKCVLTSKKGHGWLSSVSGAAVTSMFRVAAGWKKEGKCVLLLTPCSVT